MKKAIASSGPAAAPSMTSPQDAWSKLIEGNRAPEGLFFGRLSAVSAAAVGPIVVLGWFCQKQLVQGLTFGAVK